jgi:hypothetical protein
MLPPPRRMSKEGSILQSRLDSDFSHWRQVKDKSKIPKSLFFKESLLSTQPPTGLKAAVGVTQSFL